MTTYRWLTIPVVLAGGLLSIACGGGDDPVDTGPKYKYPDVSSFCEAKAEFECTATVLDRCQTTEDKCVIKRRGICGQAAPSGASYRPTEAERCLAAVKLAFQDDKYTAEEKVAELDACALLYGGGGVEGSSCTQDYQCDLDEELRCVIRAGTGTGQCYQPEEKQPGQSCEAANAVCTEGNFCTDSEQYCVERRAEGMSCSATQPCQDGLRCVGDETAAACQAKFTTGTECESDDDCQSGMCSKVGAANQCVSSVILAPNEPICDDFR